MDFSCLVCRSAQQRNNLSYPAARQTLMLLCFISCDSLKFRSCRFLHLFYCHIGMQFFTTSPSTVQYTPFNTFSIKRINAVQTNPTSRTKCIKRRLTKVQWTTSSVFAKVSNRSNRTSLYPDLFKENVFFPIIHVFTKNG